LNELGGFLSKEPDRDNLSKILSLVEDIYVTMCCTLVHASRARTHNALACRMLE